jgi:hypothetical protein
MKLLPTRIAVATALSIATLSCFAAPAQNVASSNSGPHFYLGVRGSYVHSDWKTMIYSKNQGEPSYSNWKNGSGGFGVGLYGGYLINSHFGFEAGWNRLPTVDVKIANPVPAQTQNVKISDNMFYAAIVLAQPLSAAEHLWIFEEVGPGFQSVRINHKDNLVLKDHDAIGLYGALGLTYGLTNHLGLSATAAGLSGTTNHAKNQYSTNPYIYSLSLAYAF